MATYGVGDLVGELEVIRPYNIYPKYNHHYTQIAVKAKILGESDAYLPNDQVYLFHMQGNRTDTYPPSYAFGSVSSGTATGAAFTPLTTFSDTTKSWGTDTLVGSFLITTTGTGAMQCMRISSNENTKLYLEGSWAVVPTAGTTYRIHEPWSGFNRVRLSHAPVRNSRYLGHDEYTFWIMAYDQYGNAKVDRQYFNINEFLSNRPGVPNSISPVVIARSQNLFGDNTVTVRAKQGDTVRIYNSITMDDAKLSELYPEQADGVFLAAGNYYNTKRTLSYRSNPIASGIVTNSNGEITITYQNDTAIYGSSNRKYIATAETPNFGESFGTAHWKLGAGGTADECRQIKTIWTPTTQTRIQSGVLQKFYTIECKQISQVDGSESTPTQSDFYYNTSNNGDAFNVSISTGTWFDVNKNTTILIVDINSNGSENAYWSQNVEVPGDNVAVLTNYTSLSDAITRGPNTQLNKETIYLYGDTWDINGSVYLNNSPTDLSKLATGYYFVPDIALAIQILNGVIIGKQQVGGSPVF